MASTDVEICEDLVVRKDDRLSRLLEIRVGEPGWHRNAACLTVEQAKHLLKEIESFLESQE